MKLPEQEHWAIITESSIYIPGDERSRTNPGHGYPESSFTYTVYEYFTDYSKLEEKVKTLIKRNTIFNVIKAIPMKVETKVNMS